MYLEDLARVWKGFGEILLGIWNGFPKDLVEVWVRSW